SLQRDCEEMIEQNLHEQEYDNDPVDGFPGAKHRGLFVRYSVTGIRCSVFGIRCSVGAHRLKVSSLHSLLITEYRTPNTEYQITDYHSSYTRAYSLTSGTRPAHP